MDTQETMMQRLRGVDYDKYLKEGIDKQNRADEDYTLETIAGAAAAAKYAKKKSKDRIRMLTLINDLRKRGKGKKRPFKYNDKKPLTKSQIARVKSSLKAREALKKYKQQATGVGEGVTTLAYDEYRMGDELVGKKIGDKFVKEAKRDSVLKKQLDPKSKKRLGFTKRKMGRGVNEKYEGVEKIRRDMKDRVLNHELAGGISPDTDYAQFTNVQGKRKPSAPVTIIQDYIESATPAGGDYARKKAASELALSRGLELLDANPANIIIKNPANDGWLPGIKNPQIIDLGYTRTSPTSVTKKLNKNSLEDRNVVSPRNRRLTMRYAKQKGRNFSKFAGKIGRKLPILAGLMGVYDLIDNPAQAAYDTVTGTIGGVEGLGGDLPPEEVEKRKKVNAMLMNMR